MERVWPQEFVLPATVRTPAMSYLIAKWYPEDTKHAAQEKPRGDITGDLIDEASAGAEAIEKEIVEFTEEPGLFALGRMHERARTVDANGSQTERGRHDKARVEALARECRAKFITNQRFPRIGRATSYIVAPRTACFFKLVQALAIGQLLKGPGRLANLTVLWQTHAEFVRDDEGYANH
jgi:hypothetical protein